MLGFLVRGNCEEEPRVRPRRHMRELPELSSRGTWLPETWKYFTPSCSTAASGPVRVTQCPSVGSFPRKCLHGVQGSGERDPGARRTPVMAKATQTFSGYHPEGLRCISKYSEPVRAAQRVTGPSGMGMGVSLTLRPGFLFCDTAHGGFLDLQGGSCCPGQPAWHCRAVWEPFLPEPGP